MRARPGGSLAAARHSDNPHWTLWTVPVAGGAPAPLFQHPEIRATRPDWSWKTGRIAFTGIREKSANLWLIDDGGNSLMNVPIGDPPGDRINYPSWYPEGDALAVTDYATRQVLKVDLTSNRIRPLTDPNEIWAGMASVSPGGENPIAFAGQKPSKNHRLSRNKIWIQYPGSEPFQLDGQKGRMPWWSPSGNRIVYASRRRLRPTFRLHWRSILGRADAIYVQLFGGPEVKPNPAIGVTPFEYLALHAKWSPDESMLVCMAVSVSSGDGGIAIVDFRPQDRGNR